MLGALCTSGVIERGDALTGMLLEYSDVDTIKILLEICLLGEEEAKRIVHVNSVDMYLHIVDFARIIDNSCNEIAKCEIVRNSYDVIANTKYKTVDKKVKHVAMQLPLDIAEKKKNVVVEPILRYPNNIGHKFLDDKVKRVCKLF